MTRSLNIVVPPNASGKIEMRAPVYLWRFMFQNGDVLDVEAVDSNSWTTTDLMTWRNVPDDKLVGYTSLGVVGYTTVDHTTTSVSMARKPVKRAVKKR